MEYEMKETKWLGKNISHYDVIDSTNRKAKELAEAGCQHGSVVVALEQSEGRGRLGRSWNSEHGAGVYMSMVLRPKLPAEKAPMLTLVTALAVAKAIEALGKDCGIHPFIKWPNDIVIRGKKVCGILTEMSAVKNWIDYVVIGIGINVHNREFPKEIEHMASSLELEFGTGVSRERVFELVLYAFEHYYELFLREEDLSLLREEYQQMSANKGRSVRVLDPNGEYGGVARGITELGELVVDTGEGTKYVSSGEVSVRGIYGYV